jgi:hypothetical protein
MYMQEWKQYVKKHGNAKLKDKIRNVKSQKKKIALFITNNIVHSRLWEELKCKPHLF